MTKPATLKNRTQRRKSGRSTALLRKPVIAGSLLTVGGLFGAYLGYLRPPAAFAVTGCPSGATLFNPAGVTPLTDTADLQTLLNSASSGDTICITNGFIMGDDITIDSSVTLIGNDSVNYPIINGGVTNSIAINLVGSGASVTVKYLELHKFAYALALCGDAGDSLTVTNSTISDSMSYAIEVDSIPSGRPVTCAADMQTSFFRTQPSLEGMAQSRRTATVTSPAPDPP